MPVRCDDDTLKTDSALWKWSELMLEASRKIDQGLDNPSFFESWMREAGFINVTCVQYKWATNSWPKDPKHKTLGLWHGTNLLEGLEGFSLALFTRVLGWTPQQVQVFLVKVRAESKSPRIHAYYPW